MEEEGTPTSRVAELRKIFEKTTKPLSPIQFQENVAKQAVILRRGSIARYALARKAAALNQEKLEPTKTTNVNANAKQRQDSIVSVSTSGWGWGFADWQEEGDEENQLRGKSDNGKMDEEELNRAVLRFFFESSDPARVNDVDRLLLENAHRMDEFFLELSSQYDKGFATLQMSFLVAEEESGE